MITVQINFNKKNEVVSFSLNGHAGYGEKGSDIVCSAVSAVTNMVIIGLAEKLKLDIVCKKSESGYLNCVLPQGIEQDDNEKAQILLKSMVEEFLDIETNYGKYIKVTVRE